MPTLKLALIHLAVAHKRPEINRKTLLDFCRQAGEKGARLVLAPELALSGYSFDDFRDIEAFTESRGGPTLSALGDLCRAYGLYVCLGLAERDPETGILHNSAFVLGPDGGVILRYRKINAECRWACPGDPAENNTFNSPWGRIGVLICSDSYHGLMPRVTALRGARLLLLPANWPPISLDPLALWRARALENGFYVAACNRTGTDLRMDCRQAASAVFSPEGTELLRQVGADSALVCLDLPLDSQGRLHPGRHDGPPVAWQGENRRACYLNLSGIKDLTSYLSLPPPGKLMLSCHCPAPGTDMDTVLAGMEQGTARLAILPARAYSDAELDRLRLRCAATGRKAVLIQVMTATAKACFFDGGKEPGTWDWETFTSGEAPFPSLDCGPARVRLLPRDALLHPEMVLACAKEGADLVIVFSDSFGEEERLLAGTRTIEQAAVALCSPQGSGIFMPPEAHQPWTQALTGPDGHCQAELDTGKTRKKRFQDRIDYKTLMARVYLN